MKTLPNQHSFNQHNDMQYNITNEWMLQQSTLTKKLVKQVHNNSVT